MALSPTQLRFVDEYIKSGKLAKAIRATFPDESRNWSPHYQYLKGKRMIQNEQIEQEIVDRKAIMASNANLGAQRLQKVIKEGNDKDAVRASIFAIEQADGKATQTIEQKSNAITLNIDLSTALQGELTEVERPVIDQ